MRHVYLNQKHPESLTPSWMGTRSTLPPLIRNTAGVLDRESTAVAGTIMPVLLSLATRPVANSPPTRFTPWSTFFASGMSVFQFAGAGDVVELELVARDGVAEVPEVEVPAPHDAVEQLVEGGTIRQAPAGTDADYFLLEFAEEFDASIVTNDRFRDRIEKYPELRNRLVRYMVVGAEVVLERRVGRRKG